MVPPQPARPTVQVRAVRPDRDALEIRFPRVEGYRVEPPADRLTAAFTPDSVMELTPDVIGATETQNAGIIGETIDLNLVHTDDVRPSQVLYELTSHLVLTKYREHGEGAEFHLFGQLKRIAKQWLDDYLVCKGGTYPAQLKYKMLADMACEKIVAGINRASIGERPVRAVLDPYNPTGSTQHVSFTTSKLSRWQTDPRRCHINWVVLDSDWEAEFCRVAEGHPRVRAYVKNHSLGFEVPYRFGSEARQYRPDFIVLVDDGRGEDDPLHLVVEIKGYRGEDAKVKKETMETYWVPGVNRLGSYGRWAFAEFTDVYEIKAGVKQDDRRVCSTARGWRRLTMAERRQASKKAVETLLHDEATRKNIPTAEYQVAIQQEEATVEAAYARRNRDLDPQLVWRGKDEQDWSDLVVHAPPLYIQEKVHPKALIADLMRQSKENQEAEEHQIDMFADFNGIPEGAERTEFYQHDQNWSNRMILGDSLQVMASLAEREGLRGKVQCIYIDPPYGIKFNSNFQWSTTSRDVRDGNREHITREPEQVKAFRDTWRDGVHSYLTYLRDRLTVARDLLTDSGSVFVQIGDENVHRVRAVMDEVFGEDNFSQQIIFRTTAPLGSSGLSAPVDYILWYCKEKTTSKYRPLLEEKERGAGTNYMWTGSFEQRRRLSSVEATESALPDDLFYPSDFASSGYTQSCFYPIKLWGYSIDPGKKSWRTNSDGFRRLNQASRLMPIGRNHRPCYIQYFRDNPTQHYKNTWLDTRAAMDTTYVVETQDEVVKRCILMTTDPGDLVLDPTCGSGTTAYVAEQWGRRWITVDTSRVALALARARIMGARYPYYLLADSKEGQRKEAELSRRTPSEMPTYGNVRQGFVYERVPHIQLRDIANNTEIDVIYEEYQEKMEPLRKELNRAVKESWEEWQIPRDADESWSEEAQALHRLWWEQRIARQKEIDASIAAKTESEYLYDKPYEDRSKVRVAGPFTVESISPHRVLGVDENGDVIDSIAEAKNGYGSGYDFAQVILDNLKSAGVQQAHKEDRINFTSLTPWPGELVCAEGRFTQVESDRAGSGELSDGKARRHLHRPGVRYRHPAGPG